MKLVDKETLVGFFAIGSALFVLGFALVWYYAGFWVASGVVLAIWGDSWLDTYNQRARDRIRHQ